MALTAGLSLGTYLKAGEILPQSPAPQVVVALATEGAEPIRYMTDAQGRVPEYVIGTDHSYRPTELPLIRTAWETPPVIEEIADDPAPAVEPVRPVEPVAYAPPPSLGGDILAVDTTIAPVPIG